VNYEVPVQDGVWEVTLSGNDFYPIMPRPHHSCVVDPMTKLSALPTVEMMEELVLSAPSAP